jgi:hypothetical protein
MALAPTENPGMKKGAAAGDSPFPGWEAFIPQFVHPVKVAVVEALLYIGEPLSVAQFTRLFRGEGEGFREPNVRYHLRQLVKVGVLEAALPGAITEGSRNEKCFFFATCANHSSDSHRAASVGG